MLRLRLRHPLIFLLVAATAGMALHLALAAIVTGCAGNVCTNTVTVGGAGRTVQYWWTQNHNLDASSVKVRFRSAAYAADGNPIRYKITVTAPFSSYSTLKNPDPTTSLLPAQAVDLANTWIERSAPSAAAGTVYDFVQELQFENPGVGQIDVTVEIAQYGSALTVTQATVPTQRVELDAGSISNRDEGQAFPAPPYSAFYKQCGDGVDNDLDYRTDCSDGDCVGERIQDSPIALCEAPEATCSDGLDNDGNGKTDCADPLCNTKPGNPAGTKFCGSENGGGPTHPNCIDGFDNDGNGEVDCSDDAPATGCWHTGFQDCVAAENTDALCTNSIDDDRDSNYSETLDGNPATGVDCKDYDCRCQTEACALIRHCAISERLRWVGAPTNAFVDDVSQCAPSDGIDDDLDGKIDCADTDCVSAPGCATAEAYLPPAPLGTGVAPDNPAFYFNLCNDGLDNDGNTLVDGDDPACRNRFGQCSPAAAEGLAAVEDISFLSCADALDNDLNATLDCGDAACRAGGVGNTAGDKIGRKGCPNGSCGGSVDVLVTDAAACTASENSADYCGDGYDNDGDGQVDCADAGCIGVRHGPAVLPGYICGSESSPAANCHDGFDNDSNGDKDCFDLACQDGVQCARRPASVPSGWTTATCVTIPNTTALAPIVSGGFTQVAHDDRLHIGDPYHIRFTGTGTYTSLTIVIGDAVNPINSFPFNATTCALAGTGAASMQYVASDSTVGTLFERPGETLDGFDVTLTCAGSGTTIGPPSDGFTVSVVANRNGAVEYGETTLTTQVFETTAPTWPPALPSPPGPAIDVEGVIGSTVSVPVGTNVRFQAKPGADPSGICKCTLTLGGTPIDSTDGNCVVNQTFSNDAVGLTMSAVATDGAANVGAASPVQTVNVNVVPSIDQNLVIVNASDPTHPLPQTSLRSGEQIAFSTTFRTDTLGTFGNTCVLNIYDASWTGGAATTVAWAPVGIGTNLLTCAGVYTLPAGPSLAGGRYWMVVQATDDSLPTGDVVRSNVQQFLKCDNTDSGIGACKDADFDGDGVPEGRVTPDGFSPPPAAPPTSPDYKPAGDSVCDNCVNFANADQKDANANGVGDACEAVAIGRCQYKYCSLTPGIASAPITACDDDADCGGTPGATCAAVDQPMCTVNCSVDAECSPPTAPLSGVCSMSWGLCEGGSDEGNCCFSNTDCQSSTCKALVQPFVETRYGQVYAGGDILATEVPPIPNATFCLTASGAVTNFSSQRGCVLAPVLPKVDVPKTGNKYVSQFGMIDVNGILGGKYGAVTTSGTIASPNMVMDGKVYRFDGGLTLSSPVSFRNGAFPTSRGNGLIVVYGDLVINADMTYEDKNVSTLSELASVGWIVLKDASCPGGGSGPGCGNVTIGPGVQNLVGAFFAEGKIDTGGGGAQLKATGMFVAKEFAFSRKYSSRTEGSEQISFDARVLLNPPPGLSDVSRSLPGFKSVPGQ